MKWICTLLLFFTGSFAAECGDFAPFHTDKTWHYQLRAYNGIPSIHVIDSLEVYWKILSIDADAGVSTIHTSITVLGSSRTYTVSNGETTMVEKLRADWDLREEYTDSAGNVWAPNPTSLGFSPFSNLHTRDCTPTMTAIGRYDFFDSTIGGSNVTVYFAWNASVHAPSSEEFATGIGLILRSRGGLATNSVVRFKAFEAPSSIALSPRSAHLTARGSVKRLGIPEGFSRSVFNGHFADGRTAATSIGIVPRK